MATSNDAGCAEIYFQKDSCRIVLKQGDLLREKDVHVIVIPIPANGKQESNTYPLFEKLLTSADPNLKSEIKSKSSNMQPNSKPCIILTGNPKIMLTTTPYFGNERKAFTMLNSTYINCLNLAAENKYQTIAFPTIGCGNSRFEPTAAAEKLYETLSQFNPPQNKKLNEIRLVIYDKEIYSDFTNVFFELGQKSQARIKFREISEKPSSTRISSGDDSKSLPQSPTDDNSQNYPDEFESSKRDQGNQVKKISTRLDATSPSFQPKSSNQRRDLRRYYINKTKTELHIVQGDILQEKVDAIVNAANETMLGGSGVDGIIHQAAGNELLRACKQHKEIFQGVRLPTGRSRILLSYNMCKTTHYIINTAGPRYDDYSPNDCEEKLISCYKTSLALANLYDLEKIAFTAISCGIFGYPINEGAEVALKTVDAEAGSMKRILFVLRDDDIYDAWVNKARELGLQSMDKTDADQTVVTKQPKSSASPKKSSEKSQTKTQPDEHKSPQRREVTDESTPDDRKNSNPHVRESVSEQPSSSEQPVAENEGKTEENKNDNEVQNGQTSSDSINTTDHEPRSEVVQKDTNGSIASSNGVCGRGRHKKN